MAKKKLVPESINEANACPMPPNRNPNKKGERAHPDLMKQGGSVSSQLIPLIQRVETDFRGDAEGLRKAFIDILNDPNTSVSPTLKEKYIADSAGLGYNRLAKFIADIALAGANLGVERGGYSNKRY